MTTVPGSQTVVNAGDVIGKVGKTGMFAAIPHLHFEVRDGDLIRDFAKNPLGYLPRRVHRAPVITALSITPTGATAEVSVTIENARDACSLAPDCDLDLNQVVLRIRDAGGTEIDARTVDFNARKNVARDNPEVNNIFIASEPFNRFDSIYRWTMVFKSLPVVSLGSYEVQAIDALGLNASGQVTLPGLSTCLKATTLDALATCIRDQMPGNPNRPKTKYVPPTAAEQADFATVVTQMMNGACNFALPASLAANYQIRTFTDSGTNKSYCLLMEVLDAKSDGVVDKGWGPFIVNNNATRRNLNQSAPHPIFDESTENQAINIFQDTDSRSYLMCGAHRHTNGEKCTMCGAHRDTNGEECTGFCCDSHYGEADRAHQSNTMFHAAVVALNQYYAGTPWTHISGMEREMGPVGWWMFTGHRGSMQNSFLILTLSLKDVMAINQPGFTFKLTGDCACDLNATDNVRPLFEWRHRNLSR